MSHSVFTKVLPLFRPPIALFAACSSLTGYLLVPGKEALPAVAVVAGVLLLAAGSSCLNQCQERDIDCRMDRTRKRPLPANRITTGRALSLALVCICAGLGILASAGRLPAFLGILTLAWYNGVYTLLKRRSRFAAVPGALVGMVPPAIGCAAAGGSLADPRLAAVLFLFFMWQVPHFWLQVLHHGNEYEEAGLPSLGSLVGREQLGRIVFVWICAAAASGLLLPLYGAVSSPPLFFLLLPPAFVLVRKGLSLVTSATPDRSLSAFRTLNVYILAVMALLSAEGLLLPPR
jgi:protoheme IX farnesyltransferase